MQGVGGERAASEQRPTEIGVDPRPADPWELSKILALPFSFTKSLSLIARFRSSLFGIGFLLFLIPPNSLFGVGL
ncbi:hypothetical protein M5K25_001379 [Dendrobium thyrsiflorum]|uniref:Uncharacterized protein n=1 Tax=Dendrobium thyrsiflorum TaxID=117978 RepID=A0ABD0VZ83_DENTH